MNYDRYNSLKAERRGRILTITFDNPASLNAMGEELHHEFAQLVRDLRHDKETDVVVITGSGRAFSAGGDVELMQKHIDDFSTFEATAHDGRDIVHGMLDIDKPVIARVNGHAIGLGATIMLCSDISIASENAKIGDPHVLIGLVAGDGGAVLWPQSIGYAKAKYYLLTGESMSAAEAERLGLVTKVVPHDKLDEEVYGLAERLAAGATKAIKYTKMAINFQLKSVVSASLEGGMAFELVTGASQDHREAVDAFRNKRPPRFTGT